VSWTVNVLQETVDGVHSFGFPEATADALLQFVEGYLSDHTEDHMADRWSECPDDYFTYNHVLIAGGHWHRLEFVVRDSSKEFGVLEVVWVEDHPGAEEG
jgi:hypothetical protein